ncbi:reverse transcriptase domain-containing protein [Tanacetum coccineum]|uniref:Reverse transcriptase domain-containing protein n=1 Tax=Tanacetum coccineum TaxID=301880 RepID=A0ABQ5GTL7_9ASTR
MVSRPEAQPSADIRAAKEKIKLAIHPEQNLDVFADGGASTPSGTSLECPRRMPPGQTKEAKLSARKEQSNTRRSRKIGRCWHHERSPLSLLVVKPSNGKKHDNSWRMCVDFKDLNKACPKEVHRQNGGRYVPEIQGKCQGDKGMPRYGGIFSKPAIPKVSERCAKAEWEVSKPEHIPIQAAFKQMKQLIAKLPTLTSPMEKEELIVYLAAAKEAISAVLMMKREAKQMPIYFVSSVLQGLEINYTPMEKLVLALVHASKRLKRYF